jgi:uncharacterized protein (DUF2235 family)
LTQVKAQDREKGKFLYIELREVRNNFQEGDRIYLFGFSRGAYTVRAVASLLRIYGLLAKGNDAFVPYAIRMFTGIDRNAGGGNRHDAVGTTSPFQLATEFKRTFSSSCKPHFVGVWGYSELGGMDRKSAVASVFSRQQRNQLRTPRCCDRRTEGFLSDEPLDASKSSPQETRST